MVAQEKTSCHVSCLNLLPEKTTGFLQFPLRLCLGKCVWRKVLSEIFWSKLRHSVSKFPVVFVFRKKN